MTDLTDFGGGQQVAPPQVRREYICQSPHTGKIAGFIGVELNRGQRCYTAMRSGEHFYYKEGAYAISDSILDTCWERDVTRVYIHEGDEDDDADVHEFTLRQYKEDGEAVPEEDLYDPADTQTLVPLEDRVQKWESHSGELFVRPFRKACDRIDWRGYDPELKERIQAQQEEDERHG